MNRLSGTTQFLTLDKIEGSTLYFKTEDNEIIRMNKSLQKEEYEIGQDVPAFIYPNTRGELFASPVIPKITRDKFDFVPVSEITYDGVYIDIDAPKDFLIPYEDLPKLKKVWPKPGDKVMATLRVESDNQIYGRLITETEAREMSQPFDEEAFKLHRNTWLDARPYRLLKVGSFLITNDGYKVFVHESERQEEPRLGEEVKVRVIGFNEHNEMNGSFIEKAYKKIDTDAEEIYEYLLMNGGSMVYNDKSSPEDIKEIFNISKASFKRALGGLMKEGKITQDKEGTYIKKERE